MIQGAVVKLTLWYLAIIMTLSLAFSGVLYRISSSELSRGLRRQTGLFVQPRTGFLTLPPELEQLRLQQLSEERVHLQQNLLLLNLITLGLGGAASYALARRTLHPIAEALESQSRFTADASHELRTPLTAMQTEIEVALRNPGLTKAQAKDLLTSNLEEVAKLKNLSDGLLRLARQDGQDMAESSVSLATVAAEAISRVGAIAGAKHIDIINDAGDVVVVGDETSLVELAVILLDNAIKYSGPKSQVVISAEQHAKFGYLKVADKGHGIKASDLPHIFNRFFRADASRSKERVEGYGLGLSIAQKIADLHGGSIEAKSTPGKGSVFTVKLPLARA